MTTRTAMALTVCAVLAFSPFVWLHYWCWLLLPWYVLADRWRWWPVLLSTGCVFMAYHPRIGTQIAWAQLAVWVCVAGLLWRENA